MAIAAGTPTLRLVAPDGETIEELDVLQGTWTEEQYIRLTKRTNRLIEFVNGSIEVLPMPTDKHQNILGFLFLALHSFLQPRGGKAQIAGIQLVLPHRNYREPDLLVLLNANDPRRQNARWLGADLVMEIVSPDDPARDKVEKRVDYAVGGIPEYWIVDPQDQTVTVLVLEAGEYVEHGAFHRGELATSVLLEGFAVDVNATFDAR